MSKVLPFFLGLALVAAPAFSAELGTVTEEFNNHTVPVRVSGSTPELNGLSQRAFAAHGRYRADAVSYAYDIRFSQVSANSVRVDIARGLSHGADSGGGAVSEIVTGTTLRNALLRAADVAVEKTNGQGLRGFFTARLAFVCGQGSHKEVYTSDLFFGEVRRFTGDGAIAMFPRWSPDGSRLLYTSWLHGSPDIYTINLATLQRSTFESFRGSNFSARFSPDGRRVAMILTGSGSSEIWVSDAEGHGLLRLTNNDLVKSSPCWSPDGSRIVYGAGETNPQLYVMAASRGAGSRRLAGGFSGYCSEPDWNRVKPDKIAFTSRIGGNFQIAVVDLSTGAAAVVSKAAFDGMQPNWLPDGRHLVYTASNSQSSCLSILDTESGHSVRISPTSLGSAMQASVLAR
jgi:TolB protein